MTKEQYNRNTYDPNVERLDECVNCGSEDFKRDSDEIIGYRDELWYSDGDVDDSDHDIFLNYITISEDFTCDKCGYEHKWSIFNGSPFTMILTPLKKGTEVSNGVEIEYGGGFDDEGGFKNSKGEILYRKHHL
jgi:hypothetical protein